MEGSASHNHDFASLMPAQKKVAITRRMRLIGGQVHGLQRMVEEDRTCTQVLIQVAAVREALRRVGLLVVENYLENRLTSPQQAGPPLSSEELTALVAQFSEG